MWQDELERLSFYPSYWRVYGTYFGTVWDKVVPHHESLTLGEWWALFAEVIQAMFPSRCRGTRLPTLSEIEALPTHEIVSERYPFSLN